MIDNQKLEKTRQFWNQEAAHFDNEPDHGLLDPKVYEAWRRLLSAYVPSTPATILDIGCGTGSLSVLLSQLGHDVTGIDLSPVMIEHAHEKAQEANQDISFMVMDASYPQLTSKQFDVIVCRHILWSLPRPEQVLQRWVQLLNSGGRLVMIEGHWNNEAGMHSKEVVRALPMSMKNVRIENLSNQPELWGGKVTDERYLVFAEQ